MIRLQHLFVQGVRFDTEVQYRVVSHGASRYANLPLKPPLHQPASDGGMLCAIQCAAVLGQKSVAQLPTMAFQPQCTADDLVRLVTTGVRDVHCESLEFPERGLVEYGVLQALHHGGMAMVQWESGALRRWSVIVGVELNGNVAVEEGTLRALLLLDSHGSEPWACGHNARIEMGSSRTGEDLICRHLTGEAAKVRLQCLVRVVPARGERTATRAA